MNSSWSHFPHGADIGVRGEGDSLEAAFVGAALALTAVVSRLELVQPLEVVRLTCSAPERELLLVEWLNAIIYEMDVRKMIFSQFAVKISGEQLTAEIRGERVDRERHDPAVEVKGATLTELKVAAAEGRWVAQCVIDV